MKKQKSFFNKKNKGFTVAEILVVIAIITLLSSVILVATKEARNRARIARGLQFSASVHHALGSEAVGIWSFDDIAGGIAKDSSGNENNGEIQGATLVDGVVRKALNFNGSDDYINIPETDDFDFSKTNELTFMVWIKPANLTQGANLLSINRYRFNLYEEGQRFRFRAYTDGANFDKYSNSNIMTTANEWHHIAVTCNVTDMWFYFNGKLDKHHSGHSATAFNSTLQYSTIGASRSGAVVSSTFGGIIDEVRIYNRALTSAQIRQHYVQGAKKRGLLVEK